MNKNANSADVTRLTKASWKVFNGGHILFVCPQFLKFVVLEIKGNQKSINLIFAVYVCPPNQTKSASYATD